MATQLERSPERPSGSGGPRRTRTLGVLALVLVAVAAALLLTLLDRAMQERIDTHAQEWILQRLNMLLPPDAYDNDVLSDVIMARAPDLLGTIRPVPIYRARRNGEPVAVILHTVAPDGYRGPIELLVAIDPDGTLIGVQVVRHQETPGLGDAFENRSAGWLDEFSGRSLRDPPQQRWAIRPDGGDFDAFTGATITPRAIVKAVRRTLEFQQVKRELLFTAPQGTTLR